MVRQAHEGLMKLTLAAWHSVISGSLDVRRWAWVLLTVAAMIAAIGPLWESRRRGPEATVRAYLDAVERRDLDAALAQLAPDDREARREGVALQLGNRYRVESLVLGAPSVADRLLGRPDPPAWAVVAAEVTPASGGGWKSSSTAELVELDGRWYLVRPLFA